MEDAMKCKGSLQTVKLLNVVDSEEVYCIVNKLAEVKRRFVSVLQDGDSFNAVLSCVISPEGFDSSMLRKQVVIFAIRNVDYLEEELMKDEKDSLESYLLNISHGLSYGDRKCLVLISAMWKVSITVVHASGEDRIRDHKFKLSETDIVLCWNRCLHYSGTVHVNEPIFRIKPKKDKIYVNTHIIT